MDFKNFGWSELLTIIGIAVLAALIWTGKMDGSVGGPIIAGMVSALMAFRKLNNGQALKIQAGQTSIETQGGPPPPPAPPAV